MTGRVGAPIIGDRDECRRKIQAGRVAGGEIRRTLGHLNVEEGADQAEVRLGPSVEPDIGAGAGRPVVELAVNEVVVAAAIVVVVIVAAAVVVVGAEAVIDIMRFDTDAPTDLQAGVQVSVPGM